MMADTIDIPHVGTVKKQQVIVIGAVAAGVVGYAWWRYRSAPADTGEAEVAPEPEDPYEGLTDGGFGTGGPVSGYDDRSSDTGTTAPLTNDQWSVLVKERLADSYEPAAISGAIGRYLGRQPLSTADQTIVRAAIAVAGYPPVGSYSIITGGDSELKVAPSGLKGTATATTVTLTWQPVPGAVRYRVYRDGVTQNVGASNDTTAQVGGLDPGKSYRFKVAAVSAADKTGPPSSWITVKTTGAKLRAPSGVKATATGKTTVRLTCSPVPGADGYRVYREGVTANVGGSRDTSISIGGLKAGTKYRFRMAATAGNTTGPHSGWVTVTTRKR